MDANQFLIPKQTDESLVTALGAIRDEFSANPVLFLRITPHQNSPHVDIKDKEPAKAASIAYVINEKSEVMPYFSLVDQRNNHAALTIRRIGGSITDQVTVDWGWASQIPDQNERSISYVKMMALARRHLRAIDVDAGLVGGTDSSWTRYRDSQQAILNSLQETQKTITVDFSRRVLEAEAAAKNKYDKLEEELRNHLLSLEGELKKEHGEKLKILDSRETAIKAREESFNTKEARYVARQVQQEQIDDIKKWLEGWNLTRGTTQKRWPVIVAYAVGMVVTGCLVVWFSVQNVDILKGKDFALVAWWQWILLSLKAVAPLAALITFVVYFIRWTSSWARQHSEEEFRNRARMLDIGRARWLLEAVRDAQDKNKELPPELLKELSRNLFSHGAYAEGSEIHPQTVSNLLMQGLSSIRLKSSDGAEIEASRTNKTR